MLVSLNFSDFLSSNSNNIFITSKTFRRISLHWYQILNISTQLIIFKGPLRPGHISPKRTVPAEIQKPEYAETGEPVSERSSKSAGVIEVKTPEQIEGMRVVGKVKKTPTDLFYLRVSLFWAKRLIAFRRWEEKF